jgi:protein-L-isoaspartate(D-aspartate) O-methyltransferase
MERTSERLAMIREQLRRRNLPDERVLNAMAEVPRHDFVPSERSEHAYADQALPIAAGQTISQPFIVALTATALELQGTERVLEVGTGSGYAAAVLARLAAEVYTVERYRELAAGASRLFDTLGYPNIWVRVGDGSLGWPRYAPFDAIAVAAGGPRVPPSLLAQLADGGRLVMPVGDHEEQRLVRITRHGARLSEDSLGPVRFVPLIGAEGWRTPDRAS